MFFTLKHKVAGVVMSPINPCRMYTLVKHHTHLVNLYNYYLSIKKKILRGRRIISVVKSAGCSNRGPEFGSGH